MSSPLLETLRQSLSGQFDVERELGGGGMARVFLAQERALGRRVVLKVLPPEAAGTVSVDRFKREVQLAARLQHPHIVPLLSAGEADGVPFYTMPFVEGESLRARLAREHELPVATAVRLLRDVADALAYAHAHDVVHRDIKPDNVLLAGQHAVVTDFGIAKAIASARSGAPGGAAESITQFGVAIGTPAYMAPEQASADPHVDHRADVYAIGALGYELLTGQPPFGGHSPQALLAAVISREPQPIIAIRPSVPGPLAALMMRCLEKRPADRPQSAAEVLQELEAQVTPGGTIAATVAVNGRGRRRFRLAAALAFAIVAGTAGVILMRRPPVASDVSVISVMPFVPATPDTALTRLGRDLVVLLSTNLDGVGAIRATDPLTTFGLTGDAPASIATSATIAAKARAGSFVFGTLLREGSRVRLDFALYPTTGTSEPLARASVTGPPDSVTALSDSATWSLLRQIWRRDQPPTPSVAALTTRSVAALRSYLEGERARGEGRFPDAIAAFDRAIAADSTFWLAYWRAASTRAWNFRPIDTVLRRYRQHLDELPERDRLTIAAGDAKGLSNQIAALHRVTDRFPDAWYAWETAGDLAFHEAPLVGIPVLRARADLEQAVTLNPRLAEAWSHLLFLARLDGGPDGPGADSIARRLRALGYDGSSTQTFGFSELQFNALIDHLVADSSAIRSALADSVVTGMVRARLNPTLAAIFPASPLFVPGGAKAVLALSPRALRMGPSDMDARAHRSAVEWAWASRGAFDSALAHVDRRAAGARDSVVALDMLRIAALAQFNGSVPDALDRRWISARPLVSRLDVPERSEAHWLRGALAALRGDNEALSAAAAELNRLAADTLQRSARYLQRELRALQLATRGDTLAAADSLMTIELEIGEHYAAPGFTTAIARAVASRWLQAHGRSDDASKLLVWQEGLLPNRAFIAGRLMFHPLVSLERGRLAEGRGELDDARRFYSDFLARFDRPMKAHEPLVTEARAALERLSRSNKGS